MEKAVSQICSPLNEEHHFFFTRHCGYFSIHGPSKILDIILYIKSKDHVAIVLPKGIFEPCFAKPGADPDQRERVEEAKKEQYLKNS